MEINKMSKLLQNNLDNNLQNLLIHINKLDIPNNKLLQNAWAVYKPSLQTENFISEEERCLYAEAQSFKRNENMKSLKELAIQTICDAYNGGPLTNILNSEDIQLLVDKLDVHWPIEKIYKLDINLYWKRVVKAYCKNRYLYLKGCICNCDFNWKDLGLASKFSELIENTYPENWVDGIFENIAHLIAPYITNLEIHQLLPLKKQSIENNKYNPSYQIYNYPVMDCHHGNLKVLGILTNLKSLTLEFNIEKIGLNYEGRYFECSYLDIQNLADGIKNLHNLNIFKMNHSKMDDRKLKILVKSLILCPLENLNLSYCNLNDNSCKSIGYLLLHNCKLKSLELKGNKIGEFGMEYIGHSIKLFMGTIDYIGLALNPIGENGVLAIGNCLCNRNDVHKLDFSCCVVDKNGAMQIIQIIDFHSSLISIKMNSIPIEEEGGQIFVDIVEENFNILQIEYRDCGLTINQETAIKLLLDRNKYYKENPFLRKNYFTEKDVENIDELLKNNKHPLIEKSNVKLREVYVNNISAFIPQEKNYILTNSKILKTYLYDCFQSERNTPIYENSLEAINENGNLISLNHIQRLEEIPENAVIGQQISLFSASYYFKN